MRADVAIIGAGPAGCSAALTLRQRGLSVVILDAGVSRPKPTETSAPALAQMLKAVGVPEALEACKPCYGIRTNWGRDSQVVQSSITNPFGHAWFVHRAAFDEILVRACLENNVRLVKERVSTVSFSEEGPVIEASAGRIEARWLVFANGSPTFVARITQQQITRIEDLIVLWTEVDGREAEKLISVEPVDGGWWYTCPAKQEQISLCLMTDSESLREAGGLAELWERSRRESAIISVGITVSDREIHVRRVAVEFLPVACGRRWTAAGDALAKFDPLGSTGLLHALDSGRRAALAVSSALESDGAPLAIYNRVSHQLAKSFVIQRRSQYEPEARRRQSAFWFRRIAA